MMPLQAPCVNTLPYLFEKSVNPFNMLISLKENTIKFLIEK